MAGRWIRSLCTALALIALAACGGQAGGSKVLHIYNWSDYVDPQILADFTKETGIKVVYDTFDSNEVLETKVLTGGTGYDIVVPSNHILPRFITAGAIQPLDRGKLPNWKNLSADILARNAPFDPGNRYALPYMWGTIGIGYNVDAVQKRLGKAPVDSWAIVFDPKTLAKLQDCGVTFLDASEDMYAVALNYLGKDPNSHDPADYQAATDMMLKARPFVRKFTSSAYIDALANGDSCVVIGYSGDVVQARARAAEANNGVRIAYAVPKEGSQIWFDLFAVPADAPNAAAAYAFLDYMMRPAVIARASNYVKYANANAAATQQVSAAVRDDPNIYPPPDAMRRLFVTTTKDQDLLREVNRQWTRVLTGE